MVIASLASVSSGSHGVGLSAPVPPPPTLSNGNFSANSMSGSRLQLQSSSALQNWTLALYTGGAMTTTASLTGSANYWLLNQGAASDADFNPGGAPLDSSSAPTLRSLAMNIGSGVGDVTRTRLTSSTLTFVAGTYRLSFQAKRRYASYGNTSTQYWNSGHRLKAALVGSTTVEVNPLSATTQLTTSWVTFVTTFDITTAGNYNLRFDGDINGTNTSSPAQSGILLADVKILAAA